MKRIMFSLVGAAVLIAMLLPGDVLGTLTGDVTVGEAVEALTPGSDDPTLGYANCTWVGSDDSSTGVGSDEIRWGSPADGNLEHRSGFRFDGVSTPQILGFNAPFLIGNFTHFNWPIVSGTGASWADLSVTLYFSDPSITAGPFTFRFNIDETPNLSDCSQCAYRPCVTPCPDRITFPSAYGEQTFRLGDKLYTLRILGFVNSEGRIVDYFVTQEGENNTAYLIGSLSSVLVPAPAISITKETSGDNSTWYDANEEPGPYIPAGEAVYWKYIVQNTGNVPLSNITVTDSQLGTVCSGISLGPGNSTACYATGLAVVGQYGNLGTVTGSAAQGQDVIASDPSHYYGCDLVANVSSNSPVCEGTTIELYAEPIEMASYSWTGPGGFSSSERNPSCPNATLDMAGIYTLTVTRADGCSDDATTNMVVNTKPVAAFSADATSGCAPLTVTFADQSTGNPMTWSWAFGDGSMSTDQNPSHQYADAGSYNVSLTVSGGCGEDTETKTGYIDVIAVPEAAFSVNATEACVDAPIQFYDNSSGDVTGWKWVFGDGNTSTDENPIHRYSSAGSYNVSLTVSGGCGEDVTAKMDYIRVFEPCIPSAPDFSIYVGTTVNDQLFKANGANCSGGCDITLNYGFDGSVVGIYPYTVTCGNGICENTTAAGNVAVITRPSPPPAGGGGAGGAFGREHCYLNVDMLGNITKVEIGCTSSRTLEPCLAPDFNNTYFLEIDQGTQVICNNIGKAPDVLLMREAEQWPPIPDGAAIIGLVYNFTGNYSSSYYGYRMPQCCSNVTFDQNVTVVLGYDPDELPENTTSLAVAYYDYEQGRWVDLPPDTGHVAEIGEETGLINHFSTLAIVAQLAPPPAHFAVSDLTIGQSQKVWKNIFVAKTGEDVTVTANVANDGGQEGTWTVALRINGQTVDTADVTLGPGQSQPVTFTLSGMDYGQYQVEISGLNGEFTVSRGINWWLIIGIIVGVGLITWGAIWGRRRTKKAA